MCSCTVNTHMRCIEPLYLWYVCAVCAWHNDAMHAVYFKLLYLLQCAVRFCKVLQFMIQFLLHQASNKALSSPVGVEIKILWESETSSLGTWANSRPQAERLRFSMHLRLGTYENPYRLGQLIDITHCWTPANGKQRVSMSHGSKPHAPSERAQVGRDCDVMIQGSQGIQSCHWNEISGGNTPTLTIRARGYHLCPHHSFMKSLFQKRSIQNPEFTVPVAYMPWISWIYISIPSIMISRHGMPSCYCHATMLSWFFQFFFRSPYLGFNRIHGLPAGSSTAPPWPTQRFFMVFPTSTPILQAFQGS